jgi:hypothetical protein
MVTHEIGLAIDLKGDKERSPYPAPALKFSPPLTTVPAHVWSSVRLWYRFTSVPSRLGETPGMAPSLGVGRSC